MIPRAPRLVQQFQGFGHVGEDTIVLMLSPAVPLGMRVA
jgi:hypothetical protein